MLLELKNLKKSYGKKTIVNDLNISINEGEIVGLLGPNGAGKTTAFYMAIGLTKPDKGSVFFKDKDITSYPIYKRAKLGMGYLAQEPSVFRKLTVEQNLSCILETMPLSKHQQKLRLAELLEELHLTSLRKKTAEVLSGGERRRLEITRALITNPSLLLLDEPFANIDPIAIEDLKKLIKILKQKGISVLITDHNAREIFSTVDRSYLMQDGKVLMCGSQEQLLSDPGAIKHYFGKSFSL